MISLFVPTLKEYKKDIEDIQAMCDSVYEDNFSSYFKKIDDLYRRVQSKSKPVTDSELECILTEVPMDLFAASENLNKIKLEYEVVKLKNKEFKYKTKHELESAYADTDAPASYKADWVSCDLNAQMIECQIVETLYQSIIGRVERQISMTKELIMGAKKVWDSRRSSERSHPVDPNSDLPPYSPSDYSKMTPYIITDAPYEDSTTGTDPKKVYIK